MVSEKEARLVVARNRAERYYFQFDEAICMPPLSFFKMEFTFLKLEDLKNDRVF